MARSRPYGQMSRKLRWFKPRCLVEVTTRTLQGRLLLRPSPLLSEIMVGILGRAQSRYGLRIHNFVALSNHYHLLCSPESVRQLSRFMCYFNSNLAREVARLHSWRDKVWARRYDAIPVSAEPAAQIARLRYLLAHGCKEGFVLSPGMWPGVHSANALLEGKPLRGVWFDRSREYEARRQGVEFGARDFTTVETVELTPLPCWNHLTPAIARKRVAKLVAEIEGETIRRQRELGREPLGAEFVRRQHPHERPTRSKRSPAPHCHAATRAVRRALLSAYRAFYAAYRRAADLWQAGDRLVEFPEHCFPPAPPYANGLSESASA